MIIDITSAANPRLKHIKGLSMKKNREKCGEYTVEGIKSVEDAASAGADIICIVISDMFELKAGAFEEYTIYRVPQRIFETLCDTKTPQGILAVLALGDRGVGQLRAGGMYVYCDDVRDPGNLGTVIRTADAAGFDGVLLSDGCADLYSPKTVRATMGSLFHLSVWESMTCAELEKLKAQGFNIYGGILSGNTVDYRTVDYKSGFVAVIGNESNGICPDIQRLCTPVKIPIYGGAESLNAGVAAALIMYEAANSRNKNKEKNSNE